MSHPPTDADRKLARNEQLKLLATAVNTVAASSVTVGLLTPRAALLYDLGGARGTISPASLLLGIGAYLGGAGILHFTAPRILLGLRS